MLSVVRKLISIFLLLLLAFNLFGYRLWFDYIQKQSDLVMEDNIENQNYDESSLITIAIPLSLPYQVNWPEFERTMGEINLEGTIYTYVKQRVWEGKLILKCLPNHEKMNLETARQDFFKLANDLQQNDGNQKNKSNHNVHKNGMNEYYFYDHSFAFIFEHEETVISSSRQPGYFPSPLKSLDGQPPDVTADFS